MIWKHFARLSGLDPVRLLARLSQLELAGWIAVTGAADS